MYERLEPMLGCGILGALKCVAGVTHVLPMVHGPLSCSSGHRLAMLYAGVEPLLPTTCIVDKDVALGTLDKLESAMQQAWDCYHPYLLVITTTCATAMTGEDYGQLVTAYEQRTGGLAVVVDGSGLAGDERTAAQETYSLIYNKLGMTQNESGRQLVLEGLCKTDYDFEKNSEQLGFIASKYCNCELLPGLFSGLDIREQQALYCAAKKLDVGFRWKQSHTPPPAPFGVAGTMQFCRWLAEQAGTQLTQLANTDYQRAAQRLEPLAQAVTQKKLAVGIEGSGYQAYGLASYLKQELGCRVLLCVDDEHPSIEADTVCDEFYVDVGRFELVSLMEDFGVQLVFGSSNLQADNNWDYLPFFQPVWRTVETPVSLMGYTGAIMIAERLAALPNPQAKGL